MEFTDFRALVERLQREVPAEFRGGVVEIAVSPKALPDPVRADVYTLGECIPLPAGEAASSEGIQSRVVLYHGSFAALARLQEGFDWREEAWETLTHELRHHLEWRARAPGARLCSVCDRRGRYHTLRGKNPLQTYESGVRDPLLDTLF